LFKTVLLCGCAVLTVAATCTAQQTSSEAPATKLTDTAPAATSTINRKIEVMIRSELSVPPQYDISIGARQKSDLTGFDTIPVMFSLPGEPARSQTVDFLLSKDGNTLARLSKWDIGPDPGSTLPAEGRPMRGNPQAKVTIVNFDDLECPYCARMHAEFFPAVLDHYKGLVKFVYVDYPLVEIHPWAMHAAVDANCLAAQSDAAYWNYVDYLHAHGQDVSGPDNDPAKAATALDKLAQQEGDRDHLDATRLQACVTKQDDSKVVAEMKAGDKDGVNATPTFFVNGERWAGQLEEPELWTMIDRALKAQGITPPAPPAPKPAAASPGAH
jgi:protein-disulfide isomerase